jgi:hypothetical protein
MLRKSFPTPSSLAVLRGDADFRERVWAVVSINPAALDDKADLRRQKLLIGFCSVALICATSPTFFAEGLLFAPRCPVARPTG